jgi:uncharacterized membrane protein
MMLGWCAPGAVLAQSAGSSRVSVLLWVGVLIGVVVLASVVLLLLRRHYLGDNRKGTPDRGFLDELRAMRDRGEISPEEFDRTKRSIAGRLRGPVGNPPKLHDDEGEAVDGGL